MADNAISIKQRCRQERPRVITLRDYELALLPATPYEVRYIPTSAVIGFAFDTQSGLHAFASDRVRPFRTRPNSTSFIPAGCEVASQSSHGGEYLTIRWGHLPTADGFSENRFNDHIDAGAIAAAQKLRRMILAGARAEKLDVEREIGSLIDAVRRRQGPARQPRAARWMTAHRLMLVDAFIESEIARDFLVADIAEQLGLSAGFFNRAFRAAVGKTPHDYVLDRRVARARHLIRHTDLALAAVAAACGFASQAHMTTQLRRRIGLTPAVLRDQP